MPIGSGKLEAYPTKDPASYNPLCQFLKGRSMSMPDEQTPHDVVPEDPALEPAPPSHSGSGLLDPSRPTWQRVIFLAWPVWVQQLLLMTVGLYDQYLAGNNPLKVQFAKYSLWEIA